MKRTVIEIDENQCDGCGLCASGCHESAIQIIEGKARLVGDSLCDGLGACVGECPRGAITVIEREATPYDEREVIERIAPQGQATLAAHFRHLRDHGQDSWLAQGIEALREKGMVIPGFESAREAPKSAPAFSGCPGSMSRAFAPVGAAPVGAAPVGAAPVGAAPVAAPSRASAAGGSLASRLEHWPVQLHLINPRAPFFRGAELLVAADCTAFACGAFHQALLAGRKLVIACPKLDSGKEVYVDKIRALVEEAGIRSLTVAVMDVPCCGGLRRLVDEALAGSASAVPVNTVIVSSQGGGLTWL